MRLVRCCTSGNRDESLLVLGPFRDPALPITAGDRSRVPWQRRERMPPRSVLEDDFMARSHLLTVDALVTESRCFRGILAARDTPFPFAPAFRRRDRAR